MYLHMPPTNPRKRPAPGSSPVAPAPQMQQAFNAPSQLSNADFLRWSQGAENPNIADATAFNMNNFGGGAGMSQPQYDSSIPTPSTQLARRPINHQLAPTAQRATYDNTVDTWGRFGDESIMDPQNANGTMEESDSIERLEERAAAAKRDAVSKRKQIPPFVQKLSSFLDANNTDLIRWSDGGDSFVVLDEDEFAKTLIPELFKHNNYASFVRQLNMYGFHKRVGLSDNSMKASERKNKSPSEYYNPYFKRGRPNLLWLINKAKGGTTKGSKKRVKTEEGHGDGDSDDDAKDVEETFYGNNQGSRALSAAPESGPLQRREMAVVQSQLADIQKQQGAITQAIARLRKDHNQLYQQAIAFQTLHDRHESSINAILTFLANVYNRTLDGQGPQNFAQLFANAIPQDQQHPSQGNVVDIGDLANQAQQSSGNVSPNRRQQRLLMAPPTSGSRSTTTSPAQTQNYSNRPHSGSVEELFEGSTTESPHVKPEDQQGMMDLINNTNARTGPSNKAMEFPEMLSQYESANGNSPLTTDQRNTMLSMIASQSSAPGSNNALVSPTPPPQLSLANLGYTQTEIDDLSRMQAAQDARIREVRDAVAPFSPTGSLPGLLPGLNEGSYFPSVDADPSAANLDLDQYLDAGAFYNGSSPMAGSGGFDLDGYADGGFDLGLDGANDAGRIVETSNSSGANTPEREIEEDPQQQPAGTRSPSKRRRKN